MPYCNFHGIAKNGCLCGRVGGLGRSNSKLCACGAEPARLAGKSMGAITCMLLALRWPAPILQLCSHKHLGASKACSVYSRRMARHTNASSVELLLLQFPEQNCELIIEQMETLECQMAEGSVGGCKTWPDPCKCHSQKVMQHNRQAGQLEAKE